MEHHANIVKLEDDAGDIDRIAKSQLVRKSLRWIYTEQCLDSQGFSITDERKMSKFTIWCFVLGVWFKRKVVREDFSRAGAAYSPSPVNNVYCMWAKVGDIQATKCCTGV